MKKKKLHNPDYPALRKILQNDLGRRITEDEARRFGKWILRFYAHLADKK